MQPEKSIYLDYNATAPVRPDVIARIAAVMGEGGNASSIHAPGRRARSHVEQARESVARLCGAAASQVIFTSGATESNNTVLRLFEGRKILVSAIEHPSVLDAAPDAPRIPVTADGVVDLAALERMLDEYPDAALISVMLVNNETGAIQPVAEIARLAAARGVPVHTDAVQAMGRIPLNFTGLGVAYMSLSAHKSGGPQGIGALIVRPDAPFTPLLRGGGQEKRRRAGTENVPLIAGFGLAAELAVAGMPDFRALAALRDDMERRMKDSMPALRIFAQNAPRVANTSQVSLPGLPAETQLMALDLAGYAVSSGSACSSGTVKPSHVLTAMGANADGALGALRISLGWKTRPEDIDGFVGAWSNMALKLKHKITMDD